MKKVIFLLIISLALFGCSEVEPQSSVTFQETPQELPVAQDEPVFEQEEEVVVDEPVAQVAPPEPQEVTVKVTGKNFEFSESEIVVNSGDTVTIKFKSTGGFHDWVVDEFDAATEKVSDGQDTEVTFVADTLGTFEYYCSVGSHRSMGMVGNLIVK